ncbi:unnamed protein product [Symbiodinium sp. KB8]|nr:unnamed protein product [Symbiodinium sp. KB8]
MPPRDLHGQVSTLTVWGEYDLALGLIPACIKSAPLYLLEAQAFHARAFVGNDRDGDMHRAHEGAQNAISMLRQLNTASADEALLAQALLLKANTLANLAASGVFEFKQSLNEATSAVREAESALCAFNRPDVANAYRIMGLIRQTRHHFREEDTASLRSAQRYFLSAIREYERHGLEHSSVWYAVAHWNMYNILRNRLLRNLRCTLADRTCAGMCTPEAARAVATPTAKRVATPVAAGVYDDGRTDVLHRLTRPAKAIYIAEKRSATKFAVGLFLGVRCIVAQTSTGNNQQGSGPITVPGFGWEWNGSETVVDSTTGVEADSSGTELRKAKEERAKLWERYEIDLQKAYAKEFNKYNKDMQRRELLHVHAGGIPRDANQQKPRLEGLLAECEHGQSSQGAGWTEPWERSWLAGECSPWPLCAIIKEFLLEDEACIGVSRARVSPYQGAAPAPTTEQAPNADVAASAAKLNTKRASPPATSANAAAPDSGNAGGVPSKLMLQVDIDDELSEGREHARKGRANLAVWDSLMIRWPRDHFFQRDVRLCNEALAEVSPDAFEALEEGFTKVQEMWEESLALIEAKVTTAGRKQQQCSEPTTAADEDQKVGKKKGRQRNKVALYKTVDLVSKQLVKRDVHELEVENAPDGSGGTAHISGGTSAQMSRDLDNSESDAIEDDHIDFKGTGLEGHLLAAMVWKFGVAKGRGAGPGKMNDHADSDSPRSLVVVTIAYRFPVFHGWVFRKLLHGQHPHKPGSREFT